MLTPCLLCTVAKLEMIQHSFTHTTVFLLPKKKKKEPNFVDVPFFSPSSEPIVLTTFPPISHKHATLCMKEILPTGFFTLINRKTHKVSSFSCLWKMLNLEIIPAIATALL